MIKYLVILLILVGFTGSIFVNSYAYTIGNSENKLKPNFYPYGQGILEFQEPEVSPCYYTIPRFEVKTIDSKDELLNLDEIQNNFFVVLGNVNESSFQYLQVELPSESGIPSYLLDFKKGDERVHGEFYIDYKNLAVLVESDNKEIQTNGVNYEKYFEGNSKDITSSMHTLGPDNYNFGALLLKSDNTSWIKDEKCAIRLDWHVTITNDGKIISSTPTAKVGILSDSTGKFSPLVQHKSGVNIGSIECKPGLRVILQQVDDSGNMRPACVKPETKIKLIERGWALNERIPEQDQLENKIITPEDNDKLINIKKGESFIVKLDSNYSWRMDIDNQTVVNSDYSDIRYSGSQGVYKADNSGQAILTGIGDPVCLSSDPPCKSPSILFQLNINVK
jgi:hypothetical protein